MIRSRDFRELLKLLEKQKARYLVVGGYTIMLYSEPRWTKDLDLCLSDCQIHFIGKEDLIAVMLVAGREQDLKDVEAIRRGTRAG
jgi:hypothetical protein